MADIDELVIQRANAQDEVDAAQSAYDDAQIKVTDAEMALTTAQDAYSSAQDAYSSAQDELDFAQADLDSALAYGTPEEIQAAQDAVDAAQAALDDASSTVDSTQTDLDVAQNELDAANSELSDAETALQIAQDQFDALDAAVDAERADLDLRSLNAEEGAIAQDDAINGYDLPEDTGNLAGPPDPGFGLNDLISGGKKLLGGALNILDPSGARLKAAGLFAGGKTSGMNPGAMGVNFASSTVSNEQDWRLRISLADPKLFASSPTDIQAALSRTNGVVFPYTPSVTVTHNARYSEQGLTHSNYKSYFYEGSDVAAITVSGEFTVQNWDDGQYLLAAIYFFRSSTKMFWGDDLNAGNPPPLVFLDGYGEFYFPHVSCVVTNFTHTLPNDVDYVQIPVTAGGSTQQMPTASGKTVRLPTSSTISVTLQPVYSRKNIFNNFSLTDFAHGKLLRGKGGFL